MGSTRDDRVDAIFRDAVTGTQPGGIDLAHVHYDINQLGRPGSGSATPQALGSEWPNVEIAQAGGNPASPTEPHRKPVIVLDPGHSGKDILSIDPKTGLHDHDYPNFPEINEAWTVSQQVGDQLKKDGYDVVYTKNSALDSVSLRQRADIAEQANADLAVSIHDDHGQNFNNFAQVYAQQVGEWRGGTADNPQVKFTNQQIADESQAAALNFVSERARAEGHSVDLTQVNFANRPGIDPGNISQVQLYAGAGPHPVPWVYNEVGGIGLGSAQQDAYVKGLVDAIEKSVPLRQEKK